jgi:hypothetical protein
MDDGAHHAHQRSYRRICCRHSCSLPRCLHRLAQGTAAHAIAVRPAAAQRGAGGRQGAARRTEGSEEDNWTMARTMRIGAGALSPHSLDSLPECSSLPGSASMSSFTPSAHGGLLAPHPPAAAPSGLAPLPSALASARGGALPPLPPPAVARSGVTAGKRPASGLTGALNAAGAPQPPSQQQQAGPT